MLEIDKQSFRQHLEWLVDQLAVDSAPYLEERPRFAHGVLVLADHDNGEVMKASLIKQLDIDINEQRIYSTREGIYHKEDMRTQNDSGVNLNISSPEFEDFPVIPPLIQDKLGKENDLPFVPLSKYVKKTVSTFSPVQIPIDQSVKMKEENLSTQKLSKSPETSTTTVTDKRTSISNLGQEEPRKSVTYEASSFLTPTRDSNSYEHRQSISQDYKQGGSQRSSIISVPRHSITPRDQTTNYIVADGGDISIPPMVGTYYERPEIVHRSYRSHVEQTTFPSIDRFRTVRQETVSVFEHPRRTPLMSPMSHCSSSTPTFTSLSSSIPSHQNPDAIEKAVKILQDSCEMLDETAERIASRNRHPRNPSADYAPRYSQEYTSAFQFPSELRTTNY
ncbi:unnamed protein product [Bursaphelenchus xylophilus]|uniref:(pine wood nematode) hypothetical protein n=1 Tax=Bursaphelenchus xylophilus TaxID=6326 RepID=A0A1I7RS40_BURXY|nr:unnamed protein product [Bursaphelenchus xylophilus]CAG9123247.1 unnamed protein product [Bursaphelenchus xylophilus]